MKKALIINLTRMGDLIQTIGLVKSLKRKNYEINFLCVKSFSAILKYVPEIDNIIELDADSLLKTSQKKSLEKYLQVEELVYNLNKKDYALLINPVASIPSSYLSFLIKAETKKGIIFTENREQSIKSKWSAFHLANEHNLGDHGFNLVDIFAGVGECKVLENEYKIKGVKKSNLKKSKDLPIIGFHLGASRSNKTWEKEKFKQVILRLLKEKTCNIVLFGGYNELSLIPYFDDISSELFINRIGKTGLQELISEISSLDLLITNDTGPMHIAAIQGIPIIDISLGPVSLWETAPYSGNAIILEANIECHPCKFNYVCNHLSCHNYITSNHLYEAIKYKLEIENNFQSDDFVNVYQTKFDPAGYLHNVPLFKKKISATDLFFEIKRLIWIISLNQNLEKDFSEKYLEYLSKYYELDFYQFDDVEFLENILHKIKFLLEELSSLDGINLNNKKEIDRIKHTWINVKEIKSEIFEEKNNVYDFLLYAKFRESSINSFEIKEMINETINIYKLLHFQINSLITLLKRFANESLY